MINLKKNAGQKEETAKVLLLSALAIALFLALPRLAIIIFLRSQSHPAAEGSTWFVFFLKTLYSFIIALILLWVNISRLNMRTRLGSIKMSKFSYRLSVNIFLFFIIRFISLHLDLHAPRLAASEKFYNFVYNISLALEFSLCILLSEIYMLVVKNQDIRLKNEKLLKANAETHFEVLKNQVNPHFLFNSLNTIHAMIGSDNEAAKVFVHDMSQVYRYVLNSAVMPLITLTEELGFANAYMNMLLKRHSGNIQVVMSIQDDLLSYLLPPMSVQTLFENAVKHNVVSTRYPLQVEVKTSGRHLFVSNTLQPKKTKASSTNMGLHNLNERYSFICSERIEINRDNNRFTVSLPLIGPAKDGPGMKNQINI